VHTAKVLLEMVNDSIIEIQGKYSNHIQMYYHFLFSRLFYFNSYEVLKSKILLIKDNNIYYLIDSNQIKCLFSKYLVKKSDPESKKTSHHLPSQCIFATWRAFAYSSEASGRVNYSTPKSLALSLSLSGDDTPSIYLFSQFSFLGPERSQILNGCYNHRLHRRRRSSETLPILSPPPLPPALRLSPIASPIHDLLRFLW
jgi:hypothetical protein